MTRDELWTKSAVELAHLVRTREVSSREVTESVLERIDEVNPTVNAYCTVVDDRARKQAEAADEAVARGDALGPLHGVPYSLKDLTLTRGIRTTFGSLLKADNVPDTDSLIAERMADSGGVLLGKTNTPEHGIKGVTDNKLFGATRNPWDPSRTPGGSSGGAGAAVASGMGPLAEASDFAGSIRIPASFSGVVGFKPSAGRVPRALSPMITHPVMSCNGPITRTVADAALMLQVLAGPDARDPHSLADGPHDFPAVVAGDLDLTGMRIGYSPDLGFVPVDPTVRAICAEAVAVFEQLGCDVTTIDVDYSDSLEPYMLFNANQRAALINDDYPTRKDDMDPLMGWRVELSTAKNAIDVGLAEMAQAAVYQRTRALFEVYDFIVTPATPVPPFEIGIDFPAEIDGTAIHNQCEQLGLTFVFNMTGHPAVSVPAGWTAGGLPIGLQIVGPWRDDARVLKAAAAYEQAKPWSHLWPALGA